MFPVQNHTRLIQGDKRFDDLVRLATHKANKFLTCNPTRRASTFIMLQWCGNEYRAKAKFRSNQGTSHIATAFESELK